MLTKFHSYLLIMIFCLVMGCAHSQSVHFTQYWTSPVYMNPANSGMINGKFRLSAIEKTQWIAIGKPYVSFLGGIDFPVYKSSRRKYIIGMSATLLTDLAGDSKYSTYQGILGISFLKIFGSKNQHRIGTGLSLGFSQRTIDYTHLYFDEQFQNGFFDPTNEITDNIGVTNYFYMDLGFGILWSWKINRNLTLKLNASATHINLPNQSLYQDVIFKTLPKFQVSLSFPIELNETWNISPLLFYAIQKRYQEALFGCIASYNMKIKNKNDDITLHFGLLYRIKDALIYHFGIGWHELNVYIAYDMTTSKLYNANQLRGGPEISLSWMFYKKTKSSKRLKCPVDF